MKKLILISVTILFVTTIVAQEKFVVPEISDAQKHSRMIGQTNGVVLNFINYAKLQGTSVEDLAKFTGDQYKKSWNKENGWEGFARGCLNNWTIMTPDNKLIILEQSESMIKFQSKIPYVWLKNNGPLYNVSHDEFMTFLKINHKVIGEYLGADISFNEVEDGLILTIKKN
jgi:hypothetical protein